MGIIGMVLAGGENKRIPVLKGHIEINGTRIIDSSIRLLKDFFRKIVISTNSPEHYFYCGLPMIGDVLKERGPATGIYSVLKSTGAEAVFVVACDMPFVHSDMVSLLVGSYKSDCKGRHAVVPIFDNKPEPLLGIYSKSTVNVIQSCIKEGRRSLREMLKQMDVLYIKEKDVRSVDPDGRSFININTMEDLNKTIGG
ncbi:MAG: molybdenum cofactor guanylyltransferase [Nitrospiraceae bacterium]|nr:molybdenum cofactor guanylyltransferase [Nitrospiraceae bacterium]